MENSPQPGKALLRLESSAFLPDGRVLVRGALGDLRSALEAPAG